MFRNLSYTQMPVCSKQESKTVDVFDLLVTNLVYRVSVSGYHLGLSRGATGCGTPGSRDVAQVSLYLPLSEILAPEDTKPRVPTGTGASTELLNSFSSFCRSGMSPWVIVIVDF